MAVKTIQPDSTAADFNRLNSDEATTVEATEDTGRIRGATHTLHCLIRFPTSQIPSGKIIKATMSIYVNAHLAGQKISIAPCLRTWVSAQTTWNSYSTGNAWATAGATGTGDKDTDVVTALELTNAAWNTITLPNTVVSGWRVTNNGLLFYYNTGGDGNTTEDFYSPIYATATSRPYLTITYDNSPSAGYFEV